MCLRKFSELLKQSGQYLYSICITILYGYYSFWVLSVKNERESCYTIINICSFIEKLFTLKMFWCDSLTSYVRLTSHKTLENFLINHSYLGLTKGDLGSIPGLGRSPGEGNGNPLQYSCPENPMDGGAWWATVHGVAKSRTSNAFGNCQLLKGWFYDFEPQTCWLSSLESPLRYLGAMVVQIP